MLCAVDSASAEVKNLEKNPAYAERGSATAAQTIASSAMCRTLFLYVVCSSNSRKGDESESSVLGFISFNYGSHRLKITTVVL